MIVKAKGQTKDLKERIKAYTIGMDGQSYMMFRLNPDTMRITVPLQLDGQIKRWSTNDDTNPNALSVYSFFRFHQGGSLEVACAAVQLIIQTVYRVEDGLAVDVTLPGDVYCGQITLKNLLTIEIE